MDATLPSKYQDRIDRLTEALEDNTRRVSAKDQNMPTILALMATVPFITSILLYLTRPKIVTYQSGEDVGSVSIKRLIGYKIGRAHV